MLQKQQWTWHQTLKRTFQCILENDKPVYLSPITGKGLETGINNRLHQTIQTFNTPNPDVFYNLNCRIQEEYERFDWISKYLAKVSLDYSQIPILLLLKPCAWQKAAFPACDLWLRNCKCLNIIHEKNISSSLHLDLLLLQQEKNKKSTQTLQFGCWTNWSF